MHESVSRPFLDFFHSTGRLVTVDVSSGELEPIWDIVQSFFIAKQLQANQPVDTVLVFAMGKPLSLMDAD